METPNPSRELIYAALKPRFENRFVAWLLFPFYCLRHFRSRMWCNRFPPDHQLVQSGLLKAYSVASFGLVNDKKVFWIHPEVIAYMKRRADSGAFDDIPVGCLEGIING